jgi:hypothetical protein
MNRDKARVLAKFEARGSDELSVNENEIVLIIQYEIETGWSKVAKENHDSKREGLVPTSYITRMNNETIAAVKVVTMLYDYNSTQSGDLSVTAGTKIQFIRLGGTDASGYSLCMNPVTKQQGYVPTNYHTSDDDGNSTKTVNRVRIPLKTSVATATTTTTTTTPTKPLPTPRKDLPTPSVQNSNSNGSSVTNNQTSSSPQKTIPNTPSSTTTSAVNNSPVSPKPTPSPRSTNTPPTSTPSSESTTTPSTSTPSVTTNSDTPEMKRQKKRREMVKELVRTEESYVTNLTIFAQVFAARARELLEAHSSFSDNDFHVLFGNVEQILGMNRMLLQTLKKQVETHQGSEEKCCVGQVFREMAPFFKMYTDFM